MFNVVVIFWTTCFHHCSFRANTVTNSVDQGQHVSSCNGARCRKVNKSMMIIRFFPIDSVRTILAIHLRQITKYLGTFCFKLTWTVILIHGTTLN
jgi:hypothetical protein